MVYSFQRKNVREILRSVVRAKKCLREVCGLLFDNGRYIELVEIENISTDICRFVLAPAAVDASIEESLALGRTFIGTFHSHLASDPVPGDTDIECALGEIMLIIDSCDGHMRLWRIERDTAREIAFTVANHT
jgi:proteasome lid subunit RPN8/RPN11